MTIETRLAEIRANRDKANDMVDRLCGDPSRWTLSVPVRDDDSDVILTQVTDTDLPALLAAVEAVIKRHRPGPPYLLDVPEVCEHCSDNEDEREVAYPCPTVQALADALEVQG